MTKEDLEQISNVVNIAVDKSVDRAVNKAVDKAVDRAVNKAVDKAVDRAVNKALDEAVDRAVNKAVNSAIKTTVPVIVYDIVNTAVDGLRNEILDRMFLFEQEYGDKIMAIYDVVSIMQDKLNDSQENQRKLNKRMDYIDAQTFGHEKRISNLENLIKTS